MHTSVFGMLCGLLQLLYLYAKVPSLCVDGL